eukprot:g67523.t1
MQPKRTFVLAGELLAWGGIPEVLQVVSRPLQLSHLQQCLVSLSGVQDDSIYLRLLTSDKPLSKTHSVEASLVTAVLYILLKGVLHTTANGDRCFYRLDTDQLQGSSVYSSEAMLYKRCVRKLRPKPGLASRVMELCCADIPGYEDWFWRLLWWAAACVTPSNTVFPGLSAVDYHDNLTSAKQPHILAQGSSSTSQMLVLTKLYLGKFAEDEWGNEYGTNVDQYGRIYWYMNPTHHGPEQRWEGLEAFRQGLCQAMANYFLRDSSSSSSACAAGEEEALGNTIFSESLQCLLRMQQESDQKNDVAVTVFQKMCKAARWPAAGQVALAAIKKLVRARRLQLRASFSESIPQQKRAEFDGRVYVMVPTLAAHEQQQESMACPLPSVIPILIPPGKLQPLTGGGCLSSSDASLCLRLGLPPGATAQHGLSPAVLEAVKSESIRLGMGRGLVSQLNWLFVHYLGPQCSDTELAVLGFRDAWINGKLPLDVLISSLTTGSATTSASSSSSSSRSGSLSSATSAAGGVGVSRISSLVKHLSDPRISQPPSQCLWSRLDGNQRLQLLNVTAARGELSAYPASFRMHLMVLMSATSCWVKPRSEEQELERGLEVTKAIKDRWCNKIERKSPDTLELCLGMIRDTCFSPDATTATKLVCWLAARGPIDNSLLCCRPADVFPRYALEWLNALAARGTALNDLLLQALTPGDLERCALGWLNALAARGTALNDLLLQALTPGDLERCALGWLNALAARGTALNDLLLQALTPGDLERCALGWLNALAARGTPLNDPLLQALTPGDLERCALGWIQDLAMHKTPINKILIISLGREQLPADTARRVIMLGDWRTSPQAHAPEAATQHFPAELLERACEGGLSRESSALSLACGIGQSFSSTQNEILAHAFRVREERLSTNSGLPYQLQTLSSAPALSAEDVLNCGVGTTRGYKTVVVLWNHHHGEKSTRAVSTNYTGQDGICTVTFARSATSKHAQEKQQQITRGQWQALKQACDSKSSSAAVKHPLAVKSSAHGFTNAVICTDRPGGFIYCIPEHVVLWPFLASSLGVPSLDRLRQSSR